MNGPRLAGVPLLDRRPEAPVASVILCQYFVGITFSCGHQFNEGFLVNALVEPPFIEGIGRAKIEQRKGQLCPMCANKAKENPA